jgi:AraC-like DNA-binding protein
MSLNFDEVVQNIDLQLASHPNVSLRIVAEKLGTTEQVIEDALRQVEGLSFEEFRHSKRLEQAFRQLGEISPAANGPYEFIRARQRVTIPKATIRYGTHRFWMRRSSYSQNCPLVDLSSDGLAFLADQILQPKVRVSLLLKFPGREGIFRLEGRVIYALATGIAGFRYRIGIQFLPFTGGRGGNSRDALDVLIDMEKTYAV